MVSFALYVFVLVFIISLSLSLPHIWNLFLQFGFMLIALIWKFDFSPFMVLIIAILNDGNISMHGYLVSANVINLCGNEINRQTS